MSLTMKHGSTPRLFVSVAILLALLPIAWTLIAPYLIPSRLGVNAPKSGFGVVPVPGFSDAHSEDGVDIIFVHGLGSNPDSTWRTKRTPGTLADQSNLSTRDYVCWVTDFLPEDIPQDVLKDVRVFFYNYDTYWKRDAVQTRLENVATKLLNWLSVSRKTDAEQSRRLVFVGHSYGGLVIKKALVLANLRQSSSNVSGNTIATLFLGTPHRGSHWTFVGSWLASALLQLGSNPAIFEPLSYDSSFLLDLHRDFLAIGGDNLKVFNFFEERKTNELTLGPLRWEHFTVTEQSATFDGPNVQNIGLSVDHFGLNKFGSRTDNYQLILDKILESISKLKQQKRSIIYSVPFQTVNTYTDRQELSLDIEQKLTTMHDASSVSFCLSLHGMGGSGKTQLALQYIQTHRHLYDTILWIDAKDEAAARLSFERCASDLGLPLHADVGLDQDLRGLPSVRVLLHWLQETGDSEHKWLVVIDNADDLTFGLKDVMPKGSQGSILITSQDRLSSKLVEGSCENILVDVMKATEATELLLRHLGYSPESAPSVTLNQSKELVERLGYLVLAIDLAGAYIANDWDCATSADALDQYIKDFESHQDELLTRDDFIGLSATDKTVWTVWDRTFMKLQSSNAQIQPHHLLAFLAFFKSRVIQHEMFRLASLGSHRHPYNTSLLPTWFQDLIEFKNGTWNDFPYRQAIKTLARYHLVGSVDGDWPAVTLHSLVQWRSLKDSHNLTELETCLLELMHFGAVELVADDEGTHFQRHFLQHLSQVKTFHYPVSNVFTVINIRAFGIVFCKEGRYKDAEVFLSIAANTARKIYGPDHETTLHSISWLTVVYSETGKLSDAEDLTLQVLETRRRNLPENDPSITESLLVLSGIYHRQGRWREAETLDLYLLERTKSSPGPENLTSLQIMSHLAAVYRELGQYNKALALQEQEVEISSRIMGPEASYTIKAIDYLADLYSKLGKLTQAEGLARKAVQLGERVHGPKHPQTLKARTRLAMILNRQGRVSESEKIDLENVELAREIFGPNDPVTLTKLAQLANDLIGQGRLAEAEEILTSLLREVEESGKWEDAFALGCKYDIAIIFERRGQVQEATKLMLEVLESQKAILGADHPLSLASMHQLVVLFWKQGSLEEAREMSLALVELRKQIMGPENLQTLDSMYNLARVFVDLGQLDEAEPLGLHAWEVRNRTLGPEHEATLTAMSIVSSIWYSQGRFQEASELRQQVLDTQRRVLGHNHPDTLGCMYSLAHSWNGAGQHRRAKMMMIECYRRSRRLLGPDNETSKNSQGTLRVWEQEAQSHEESSV